MGIVSRFFLLLYVLVVGSSVVAFAGVCLRIIPKKVWQTYLNYVIMQPETKIVLGVMFLFSLYFLAFSFKKQEQVAAGEIMLKAGEPGEVKVTVDAIKRVIERAALSVNGVRDVNITLLKKKGEVPIAVRLVIILGQGHSAPGVSEAVVNAVDKAIFTALQIGGVPVDIKVKDITNAVVERKKRVV